MKITKEEYYTQYSDDITKKAYDRLMEALAERCDHIVRELIAKPQKIEVDWWDFENAPQDPDDGQGSFDLRRDEEWVEIVGQFKRPKNSLTAFILDEDGDYDQAFPVEFIWMSDKEVVERVLATVEKYEEDRRIQLEKSKAKREVKAARKKQIQASIKSKLTPEELDHIKFK